MTERLGTAAADGVLTLTLRHGAANAIDAPMVEELLDALAGAGEDPAVRALVLTGGAGRIFCAGFDLTQLVSMARDELLSFLDEFAALYTALFAFPKPVVAALNGHAIAGGMLLAATADVRVAVRGGARFGVNEIDLGVPLPAGCVVMMEYLLGQTGAFRAALTGRLYEADEALAAGLVDELCDGADAVVAQARAEARALGAKPPAAYAAMKALLRGPVAERMAAADADGHDGFVDHWIAPEAQARLAKVLEGLRARGVAAKG
jgi:enoyl-CoA hydratase/carnithine racemase